MLNATELLKALPADVRLARMEALVDASQQLNRTSGLSETLYSILELVSFQLAVERVTVFLFDDRSGKLHARQMTNAQRPGADEQIEIVLEPGKGLAGYVAESGESLLLNDVRNDERFDSSFDERTGFVTRTMLCVPLHNASGKLLGALQAINRIGGEFSTHDLAYLEAFAAIAAVAVEREQLTQASMRSQLLSTELDLARRIQTRLLPPAGNVHLPEAYSAWGFTQACYDVGGDAYDVTMLATGECAFWVADVSGKGIGAALLMTTLQTELRALIHAEPDLARLAAELNHRVTLIAPLGTYATLFLGVLSAAKQRLRYVNAGHIPPQWANSADVENKPEQPDSVSGAGDAEDSHDAFSRGGTPIGLIPDATFEAGEVTFPVQARLAVFSDGVTDAEDTSEETYEAEGVAASLAHLSSRASAEDIGRAMLIDLDRFRIGAPAKDDTTLLIVGLY